MAAIDRSLVESIVREALAEITGEKPASASSQGSEARPSPFAGDLQYRRPQRVVNPGNVAEIQALTPARIGQGHSGSRYLTSTFIGLRAEHAIAIDAVRSEVPDGWAEKLGCIALKSRAKDRDDYLLHPDHGRRLDDESRQKLEREGSRGVDVQVILSDGLAAWGILESGPVLLPALHRELEKRGFKVGKPVFVKFGRIGVQDEIGTALAAKSTLIAVGERPGLGTGNSLSIYTAYAPKLGQDNAEKDCISNIRGVGIPPAEAATEAAELIARTFKAGGGGTHLTRSGL